MKKRIAFFRIRPEDIFKFARLPSGFKVLNRGVHYEHLYDSFSIYLENESFEEVEPHVIPNELNVMVKNTLTNMYDLKISKIESGEKVFYKSKDDKVKVELDKDTWELYEKHNNENKVSLDDVIKKGIMLTKKCNCSNCNMPHDRKILPNGTLTLSSFEENNNGGDNK